MATNAITAPRSRRARINLFAWSAPSLADIFFFVILFIFLGAGSAILSADGDAARHLAVGTYMLDHRAIPTVDLFSHTMGGQDFVPYEWLAEITPALAFRLLGLAGPVLLAGVVAALTFALLFRFMIERGTNVLLAAFLTCLAASVSATHWLARPHIFTLLFTMLWYRALDRHHRGQRAHLYLLPVLMVAWANIHGGLLIAFVLLAVFGAAELITWRFDRRARESAEARQRFWSLVVVGALSLAATLFNPASYRLIPHLLGYFRQSYSVSHTQEYLSPNFHDPAFLPFMLLLLGTMVVFALGRFRVGFLPLVLVSVFTYFSLYSARNMPLFAIVVTPIIALKASHLLKEWRPEKHSVLLGRVVGRLRRSSQNALEIEREARGHLVPLLVVVALGLAFWLSDGSASSVPQPAFRADKFPVEAAQFVEANQIPGKMFNELVWGGYLIYRLYPQYTVFIDGQTDFYGDELVREYARVVNLGLGWESVLDKYDVGWIVKPSGSALATLLVETERWKPIYRDGTADIFVRNSPPYRELIERYGLELERANGQRRQIGRPSD